MKKSSIIGKSCFSFVLLLAVSFTAAPAKGDTVPFDKNLTESMGTTKAWVAGAFAQPTGKVVPKAGIFIERTRNPIFKNQNGWKGKMTLGDQQYSRGIYMDTPALVRVELGEPVEEFTAHIGIDNNDNTRGSPNAGSARFHVAVDGKRVFSSPILKLADKVTRVKTPLGGATGFTLEVDDAGDGIGHDQCDWAEAAVRLKDGTRIFLDDLDLHGNAATRRLRVPFSFKYDGKSSDEFLDQWDFSAGDKPASNAALRVNSYKDPKTGLRIECEIKTYPDSAAVDWVCYLSATGAGDTGLIEDFMPLDADNLLGSGVVDDPVILRWSNGDMYSAESFMPFDETLEPGKPRQITSSSSDTCLPFFNLQGKKGGCVLAVGWTGQWMAEFTKQIQGGVRVRSGMAKTRFRLHPGERVRTPRIVVLPWAGDEVIHGHNQFRRLMLKHYVQWRNGKPAEPPIGHPTTTHMISRGIMPSEKNQLPILEKAATLGVELFWMDAYWQPQPWYETFGDWDPRPQDFPNGMRPLSDAAHQRGMTYVQWFLPPAVSGKSKLAKAHPDFIHGGEKGGLWKFDEPEAREFMTQYISERIKKWGIDIYREDGSGMPPEEGPDDRQGVRQMKYVEGWYRYWSDLMERNPGLTIDNCAGGGNRIDLEACSRAYVLWRTDFEDVQQYAGGQANWSNMGRTEQVLTGGLSLYFPFHSGVAFDLNPYGFRSSMSAGMVLHRDIQANDFNDDLCRKGIAEFKQIRPLFQGDLYPLLNLTTRQEDWYAYQLDRPDLGEGCAFFFRRPQSRIIMCDITLYNIDPQAAYEVSLTGETYEPGPWKKMGGRELMKPEVRIDGKPASALIRYRRVSDKE